MKEKLQYRKVLVIGLLAVLLVGSAVYFGGASEIYKLKSGRYIAEGDFIAIASYTRTDRIIVDKEKQICIIEDVVIGKPKENLEVPYTLKKSWKHGTVLELDSEALGGTQLRLAVSANRELTALDDYRSDNLVLRPGQTLTMGELSVPAM